MRVFHTGLVSLCIAHSGCKDDSPQPDPGTSTAPTAAAAADPVPVPNPTEAVVLPPAPPPTAPDSTLTGKSVLESSEVAARLPKDTLFVATFSSVERLFEIVGRDAVVEKTGNDFVRVFDALFGTNPLESLDAQRKAGVDTSRPLAAFLSSELAGTVVPITDRDAYVSAIKRRRRDLVTTTRGEFTILCEPGGWAASRCDAVTESYAYAVFSGQERVEDFVSSIGESTSLGANDRYKQALNQVEGGQDLAMFVNLELVGAAVLKGDDDDAAASRVKDLEERLEVARESKNDENIAFLEAELEWENKWQERQRGKTEARRALMSGLVEPARSLMVGVDFGARDLQVHALMRVDPDSPLKRLLRNDPGVAPLTYALGEEALLLGAAHLDPGVALEMARNLSNSGAVDLSSDALGYDLLGGVLTALDGSASIAISGALDDALDRALAGGEERFDLDTILQESVLVGVAPDRSESLLATIAPVLELGGAKGSASEGWTMAGGRIELVAAKGHTGLLGTDAATVRERVKQGDRSPTFAAPARAEYVEALGADGAAILVAGRPVALAIANALLDDVGAEPPAGVGDPDTADAALLDSEALRAARKTLADIEAKVGATDRARDQARLRFVVDAERGVGPMVAAVSVAKDGFELRASQYLASESWAAVFATAVEEGLALEQARDAAGTKTRELWKQADEARAEIRRLEAELEHAREVERMRAEAAEAEAKTTAPEAAVPPSAASSGFDRGKRVPRVRQAKAKVQGALDKDIIRRIVRAHINEVRGCYNAGLETDPALQGRVAINFVINTEGKVVSSVVQETSLKDPSVAKCIAKAVKGWKFPRPRGESNVIVTYPFTLSPG